MAMACRVVVAALVGFRKTVLTGKVTVMMAAVARERVAVAAITSRATLVSAVAKARVAVSAALAFVRPSCRLVSSLKPV